MPIFDSGTVTFFMQSTAPVGWTKDTTNFNNSALRVVSGTVSSGGSIDVTTAFTTTPFSNVPFPIPATGATTLATPNLPIHQHPSGPARFWGGFPAPTAPRSVLAAPANPTIRNFMTTGTGATSGVGSGSWGSGSHTHPVTCTVSGSSGDLRVRYADTIRCTKN